MCVNIANTDKDCGLLYDRPILSSGRTPHDKQNRNCLRLQPKYGLESQRDWAPRRTDGPSVAK